MTITSQDVLSARILIVDDQPCNVALLEGMLGRAGYSGVHGTVDPKAVKALHRQTPFDLILLDLQTPVMDGFQVMESLHADEAGQRVPVLVTTAQPDLKLRALQAGAKDFLSKPFDLVEVQTRIHNLIEAHLLNQQLVRYTLHLEQLVLERTAELRESESRYRALTELSTDWYWEQDSTGRFTSVSGPALEMLGFRVLPDGTDQTPDEDGWDGIERQLLHERIAARSPFLDLLLHRTLPDGTVRQYRVSGTPVFDNRCTLTGYRGFGVEVVHSGIAGRTAAQPASPVHSLPPTGR